MRKSSTFNGFGLGFGAAMGLVSSLALSSWAGCAGGGAGHDPNAPLSPAAAKIQVAAEAAKECKKLGRATGRGRDPDEKIAEGRALDSAKEQAVKLGGDTVVPAGQTAEPEAGQGGTILLVAKTVDVYVCGAAK
jgi:hypothetical protein